MAALVEAQAQVSRRWRPQNAGGEAGRALIRLSFTLGFGAFRSSVRRPSSRGRSWTKACGAPERGTIGTWPSADPTYGA